MPIYQYECPNGHIVERVARITEPTPPAESCPTENCGLPTKFVVAPIGGLRFKGRGFHATDYGKEYGGS